MLFLFSIVSQRLIRGSAGGVGHKRRAQSRASHKVELSLREKECTYFLPNDNLHRSPSKSPRSKAPESSLLLWASFFSDLCSGGLLCCAHYPQLLPARYSATWVVPQSQTQRPPTDRYPASLVAVFVSFAFPPPFSWPLPHSSSLASL